MADTSRKIGSLSVTWTGRRSRNPCDVNRSPRDLPQDEGSSGGETIPRRLALPALCAALALRLALALFAIEGYEPTAGDPKDYVLLAENVRAGRGFALPWFWSSPEGPQPLRPTALRPPLYPLFLAAVFDVAGHDLRAVAVAQAVIDTLSCALLGWTAAALWGGSAGLVALWWAALDPALWVHVARIWSECLFIALGVAILFALSVPGAAWFAERRAWFCGALLGLLCLTRPNGFFFLPVVLSAPRLSDQRRRRIGAWLRVAIAASLVIAPWAARNYRCFGRFIPLSTMDGVVMRGAYNDEVLADSRLRGGWSVTTVFAEALGATDELSLRDRYLATARVWIRAHWRDLPRLAVDRFTAFWGATWYPSEIHFLDRAPWLESVAGPVYFATLAFALLAVWRNRGRRHELRHLLAVPVSFSLSAMLTWGDWRIRAPVEPVLVLWAAAFWCTKRSPRKSLAPSSSFSVDALGSPRG
jgi:hypothetical protein